MNTLKRQVLNIIATFVGVIGILILGFVIMGRIVMSNGNCIKHKEKCEPQKSSRIKVKEQTIIKRHRYTIIEIDGTEYITSDDGGICRLSQ